jgi:hypothetical protein
VSERIRRINRYNNTGKKRWTLFLVRGAIVAGLGAACWLYFSSQPSVGPQELTSNKVSDKNILAAVCRSNTCYWLNKSGMAFNQGGQLSGNIVLSIEDKTERELKVGDEILPPVVLAEVLFWRGRIAEEIGVTLNSGEIQDPNLTDFDFTASDGWKLKLSIKENAYKTIEVLKQTLAEVSKTAPISTLDYIDLRIPNKVYHKFK